MTGKQNNWILARREDNRFNLEGIARAVIDYNYSAER